MAYQQKDGQGSIFKNDDKQSDKHPDYSGSCLLNGQEYWVNGWIKKPDGKKPYMSLSIKPKEVRGASQGSGGGGRPQQAPRSQQSYDEQRGGGRQGGGDARHSRDYNRDPDPDSEIPFSWLIVGAMSVASLAYSLAGVGGGLIT